jgi:hypothetical protein
VGLWNANGNAERARQRLEAVGANSVCMSFAECIAMLEIRFSATKRGAPAPTTPTRAGAPLETT